MTQTDREDREQDELRWSALMTRAQKGHEADYRQLLTELSGVTHRYLRSRFGNHHFLEDCVQETLVAIHQARHTYDSNRRFCPWFFAIVRHKAIDGLRKQCSQQELVERHREEQLIHARDTGQQDLENGVARGRLMEALSPQYREAITLTKINGLSVAEAAAQLSISPGAVKVRVHRAIGRLKRLAEADRL